MEGDEENIKTPRKVQLRGCLQERTIIDIAAGLYHSLVLTSDGTVCVWGENRFGQLGIGSYLDANIPVSIPNLQVNRIYAGYYHSIFVTSK